MPRKFRPPKRDLYLERMFETRSEAWEKVGLSAGEASGKVVRKARRQIAILLPLLIGVKIAYDHQHSILGPGHQTEARIVTVTVLMLLGWALARDVGRAAGPTFLRRMDPATAGTVGFLIRLVTILITLFIGLRVVGVQAQTLAVGGAFTAVVLGLAAQQTLGNVIAGMVLLSARPFRVGERVRLQAGAVGGSVEGTVSSLGLLYTTLTRGYDRILIPNNVVLAAAVVPLKEPESVDVKVRLSSGVRPSQVQAILDNEIATPTRSKASVLLEEVDGNELVVRVQATPELAYEGATLADEIIAALASVTGEHETVPSRAEAAERRAAAAERAERADQTQPMARPARAPGRGSSGNPGGANGGNRGNGDSDANDGNDGNDRFGAAEDDRFSAGRTGAASGLRGPSARGDAGRQDTGGRDDVREGRTPPDH
jgi:small-conductance mechanosensitive channel